MRIFVTLSTRQAFSGWLNDEAPWNILHIVRQSLTLSTVAEHRGHIRDLRRANCPIRLAELRGFPEHPAYIVTLSTRQPPIGRLSTEPRRP